MRPAPLAILFLLAGCATPVAKDARPTPPAPAPVATPAPLPVNNPAVGGIVPAADRTIADTLPTLPTLASLTGALTTAGMADTLRGAGPVTLFAPTDEAFGRLQPGAVEALMKPENRAALVKLLGLHLVAERLRGVDLMARVAAGGGRATLTSIAGEPLTVTLTGGVLTLTDAGGNRSYIEVADIRQSNGMIHVVNGVLVPRLN